MNTFLVWHRRILLVAVIGGLAGIIWLVVGALTDRTVDAGFWRNLIASFLVMVVAAFGLMRNKQFTSHFREPSDRE